MELQTLRRRIFYWLMWKKKRRFLLYHLEDDAYSLFSTSKYQYQSELSCDMFMSRTEITYCIRYHILILGNVEVAKQTLLGYRENNGSIRYHKFTIDEYRKFAEGKIFSN